MKLSEIQLTEDDETPNWDSIITSNPVDDRAGQQTPKHRRKPVITLRHINKLKKMRLARNEEIEKRKTVLGMMYAAPTGEEGM